MSECPHYDNYLSASQLRKRKALRLAMNRFGSKTEPPRVTKYSLPKDCSVWKTPASEQLISKPAAPSSQPSTKISSTESSSSSSTSTTPQESVDTTPSIVITPPTQGSKIASKCSPSPKSPKMSRKRSRSRSLSQWRSTRRRRMSPSPSRSSASPKSK